MTPKEVIVIRTLIKEAYPYVKMDSDQGDEVWLILFQEYDFKTMYEALIDYIKHGNKFAPSAAELIKLHDESEKVYMNDVVGLMDQEGYFDDPEDTPAEIATWNHKNRVRKAVMWVENKNGPAWFMIAYQKFYDMLYPKHVETNKYKYLKGTR